MGQAKVEKRKEEQRPFVVGAGRIVNGVRVVVWNQAAQDAFGERARMARENGMEAARQ